MKNVTTYVGMDAHKKDLFVASIRSPRRRLPQVVVVPGRLDGAA